MNFYYRQYKRRRQLNRIKAAAEGMAVSGFCMALTAGIFADCENLVPWAVLTGLAIVLLGTGAYLSGRVERGR